jgi:hypothetical protein
MNWTNPNALYQARLLEIQQRPQAVVGSVLERRADNLLPFQQLDDRAFRQLYQGQIVYPLPQVHGQRTGLISERNMDANALNPMSRYQQVTRYTLRPPLTDNVELALQTLYARFRANPLFTNNNQARIRIVMDTRERLVDRRNGAQGERHVVESRVYHNRQQLDSMQGYIAFRDTFLMMYNSNEEFDLAMVEFYFEVSERRQLRGGDGTEDEEEEEEVPNQLNSCNPYHIMQNKYRQLEKNEDLKQRCGILFVPRRGHRQLCGWMAMAYFLIRIDPSIDPDKFRVNVSPLARQQALVSHLNQWKVHFIFYKIDG